MYKLIAIAICFGDLGIFYKKSMLLGNLMLCEILR